MDLIGHCSHIHTQVPANYLWYSKILQVKSRKLCWWYYNHFLRSNNGYHFKLIPISYSIVFFIEKRQNTFLVVYRANSYVRFVDNFSMQSRLVNKGSLSSSMSCRAQVDVSNPRENEGNQNMQRYMLITSITIVCEL